MKKLSELKNRRRLSGRTNSFAIPPPWSCSGTVQFPSRGRTFTGDYVRIDSYGYGKFRGE